MDIEIKQMLETSFLDWDGRVVTVLYVPKCNFRCPFCHNWPLFENPEDYDDVPFERIEKYLEEHGDFIDGICLTGGEPTVYAGLPDFLKKIRALGMEIKLDTNGYAPDVLRNLIDEQLVDFIAMDIKAPLDERYSAAAGVKVDIKKIRASIKIIMNSDIDYEFRTTIVPTLITDEGFLDLVKEIEGAKRHVIQQFVPKNAYSEELRKETPYGKDVFNFMMERGSLHVKEIVMRGNVD